MAKEEEKKPHQLGRLIGEAAKREGYTLQRLASDLGVTYEHIRRIVNEGAFPGTLLLMQICEFLHMDKGAALAQYKADKAGWSEAKLDAKVSAVRPDAVPDEVARLWQSFSKGKKLVAMRMLRKLAAEEE